MPPTIRRERKLEEGRRRKWYGNQSSSGCRPQEPTQASSSQKIIFNYLIIYQKANKVSELLRALELVTTKALGVQPDLVTLSF